MDEAGSTLQQIIALEPTVLNHRLRQVAFYDQQQQYDKAEAVLKEAIRLDPENETRRLALVEYVAKRRGLEQAETALLDAHKDLPRSAKVWFAVGGLYESTQRADKARETYRAIQNEYQKKPEGLEAQVKLAGLDWIAGKTDDAERQIQEVLKENSRSTEALLLRGKIALQRGNGKDATQDFRSVVKDQPESADGHVLLARAYLMTGETMLARESLDQSDQLEAGVDGSPGDAGRAGCVRRPYQRSTGTVGSAYCPRSR